MNLQYGRETVSGTLNATSVVAQDRGKGTGETKKGFIHYFRKHKKWRTLSSKTNPDILQ